MDIPTEVGRDEDVQPETTGGHGIVATLGDPTIDDPTIDDPSAGEGAQIGYGSGVMRILDQPPASLPRVSPLDRLRDGLGTLRLRSLATPLWRPRPKAPKVRTKAQRRRRLVIGAISAALLAVVLATQLNGAFGGWLADELRALLGPQATAQVESWYLGVQDRIQQAQYQLSGHQQAAPWSGPTESDNQVTKTRLPNAMPLPPVATIIQPALPGEGVWTTEGLPPSEPGQPPIVAKTFLRPDPARPYAVVTLLQFDMRYLTLHMVAGKTEPGGPLGHFGPGKIPTGPQQDGTLFAAFNGGFKYADGHYGLMTDGTVFVPAVPKAATIAVTKEGQFLLGEWGRDPGLSPTNTDLVSYRQNASLLLDHGQLNPLTNDGWAWGGTVLNSAYTWRSGVGITTSSTLLYAAGDSVSAATLGVALRAAGANLAMQTDINPYWVRAFLYQRTAEGQLQITKLHPGMEGTGKEYLQGTERDFFYITREPTKPSAPSSGPHQSPPGDSKSRS